MSGNSTRSKTGPVTRVRHTSRRHLDELLQENVRLRGAVDTAGREEQELRRRLADLQIDLERRVQQHTHLLALLGAAEAAARDFETRFAEIEHLHAHLARMYAACSRLHASVQRGEVVRAIQEIIVNLVGSEELAIMAGDFELTPLAVTGVDAARPGVLDCRAGILGRSLATRTPVFDDRDPTGIRASIPLVIGDRTLGVVLIFGLLPHKRELGTHDRELLELVASHAAIAFYRAELHEKTC